MPKIDIYTLPHLTIDDLKKELLKRRVHDEVVAIHGPKPKRPSKPKLPVRRPVRMSQFRHRAREDIAEAFPDIVPLRLSDIKLPVGVRLEDVYIEVCNEAYDGRPYVVFYTMEPASELEPAETDKEFQVRLDEYEKKTASYEMKLKRYKHESAQWELTARQVEQALLGDPNDD